MLPVVLRKYFLSHASAWFSPVNVALSVWSEVSPYCLEAVSSPAAFPKSVNIHAFLNDPKRRSRYFFTQKRKEAPTAPSM